MYRLFAQRNLPAMKVVAGASYIPVTANFSAVIQPFQKALQPQTNQNFFQCSPCIIWSKLHGKWYQRSNFLLKIHMFLGYKSSYEKYQYWFSVPPLWDWLSLWRDQLRVCQSTKCADHCQWSRSSKVNYAENFFEGAHQCQGDIVPVGRVCCFWLPPGILR